MRVVRDLLHAMHEGNKFRFCLGIYITTQYNGEVLKIKVCLDSDAHDATNPAINWTLMWVFRLF